MAIEHCSIYKTGPTYAGAGGNGISVTNCTGLISNVSIDSSFAAAMAINEPVVKVPAMNANTARGCGINGIKLSGVLRDTVTLTTDSIPYYLAARVTVEDSASLSFAAGAIVKFGISADSWNRDLRVYGALHATGTAENPVIFTSILDDSAGGATSADTINPLYYSNQADWQSIAFIDSGATGEFDHCVFKYGGYGNNNWNTESGGMVYIGSGKVSVTNSTFSSGRAGNTHGGAGIFMRGGTLAGSHNSITDCQHGVYANGSIDSASFTQSNFSAIAGYGAYNTDTADYIDATNCWWGDATGPSGEWAGSGAKVSKYVTITPFAAAAVNGSTPVIRPDNIAAGVFHQFVRIARLQNGRMHLTYALQKESSIQCMVYAINGREMFSYSSDAAPMRHYGVLLPPLPSGMYLYRFASTDLSRSGRLIVVGR